MKTSIARKILMALSGFFLLLYLLQHLAINFLSMFSEDLFNTVSHFMGTDIIVQFILQPILLLGIVFHLGMGVFLELQNTKARNKKYAKNNGAANSTWMSRNMLITGIVILLFLGLHFYDFWIPELSLKYVEGDMTGLNAEGGLRYWEELHHKFHDPIRTGLYGLSFIFLALHLLHGFQSAFQSVGFRHSKYTPTVKRLGDIYGIVVPLGFIVIAIYHFATQL